MSEETFRRILRDGSFIEGRKGDFTHVHYDPSTGSDVPVAIKDEQTGMHTLLRTKTTLQDLRDKGLI